MSVDFALWTVIRGVTGGAYSVAGLLFLLKVRHTDPTLESCSDLLFSREGPPKPNFFRNDEVFDVKEPVLTDLDLP